MRYARELLSSTVVGGLLVVVPIYLAFLLLLKGVQAAAGLVRPIHALLPAWLPAANVLAFLILLIACAVIGLAVRTRTGPAVREHMEKSLFGRLPGYALFRSLTQRLAGRADSAAWKPAMVRSKTRWCLRSSWRRSTMTGIPSSCLPHRRRWPVPSMFSRARAFIPSTFRSCKPSGAYRSGGPARERSLPR